MKLQDFDFRMWNKNSNDFVPKAKETCGFELILDKTITRSDKESICELELWTGLLDCKGNKIYENDIVCIKGGGHDDIALVQLHLRDGVRFGIKLKDEIVSFQYVLADESIQPTIEIIGNIHQNAELFVEKSKVQVRKK